MIRCIKAKTMFSMYLDHELNKDDKDALEMHLSSCSDCRAELAELQQVISLVAGIGEEDLPEEFKEKLHEKLVLAAKAEEQKADNTPSLRYKYLKILSTLAACLLLVFFTQGILNGHKFLNTGMKKSEQAGQYNTAMNEAAGAQQYRKSTAPASGESGTSGTAAYDIVGGAQNKTKAADAMEDTQKGAEKPMDGKSSKVDEQFAGVSPQATAGNAGTAMKATGDSTAKEAEQAQTPEERDPIETIGKKLLKNLSVTVVVEDVKNATTQTKTYASYNGVTAIEPVSEPQMAFTTASLLRKEPMSAAVELRLPSKQYEQLNSYLMSTYGKSNVTFGEITAINVEEEAAYLTSRLEEVNTRIKQMQEQNDKEGLDRLNLEKEGLTDKINKINSATEYTFMDIKFIEN